MFWVSYVMLWVLVLVQSICILYLFKMKNSQSASGHGDMPLKEHGLPLATLMPNVTMQWLHRQPSELFKHINGRSAILFTAPGCDACKAIYPLLPDLTVQHPDVQFVLVVVGREHEAVQLAEEYKLADMPIAVIDPPTLHEQFKTNFVPFGYTINEERRIVSKGSPHIADHLNELLVKKAG